MAIKQLLVPMAPPDLAPLQDLAPPHLPHAHQPRLSGQKLSPSPVPQQLRQENVIPLSSGILQVGQGHNSWGDFFFFFFDKCAFIFSRVSSLGTEDMFCRF